MKRTILEISINDADRAFYAQSSGDWSKALDQLASKFRELAPGGIIQKQNNRMGQITFLLPAEWPISHLPDTFQSWIDSLIEKKLDCDWSEEEGFRPEKLIPFNVRRYSENDIYLSMESNTCDRNRTIYVKTWEMAEIGYYYNNVGQLMSCALLPWKPYGDIWHVIRQMPEDVDILDLIKVQHND